MKNEGKKFKSAQKQCGFCTANFEIWLNNSKLSEDKKEKISQNFGKYCPICVKIGEK